MLPVHINLVNNNSDDDLLKAMVGDRYVDQEELFKALDKTKLVQKEIQVKGKNGQTHTRKQWVRAGEEPKGNAQPKKQKDEKADKWSAAYSKPVNPKDYVGTDMFAHAIVQKRIAKDLQRFGQKPTKKNVQDLAYSIAYNGFNVAEPGSHAVKKEILKIAKDTADGKTIWNASAKPQPKTTPKSEPELKSKLGLKKDSDSETGETWFEGDYKGHKVRILQEKPGDSSWWNVEIDSKLARDTDNKALSFNDLKEAESEVYYAVKHGGVDDHTNNPSSIPAKMQKIAQQLGSDYEYSEELGAFRKTQFTKDGSGSSVATITPDEKDDTFEVTKMYADGTNGKSEVWPSLDEAKRDANNFLKRVENDTVDKDGKLVPDGAKNQKSDSNKSSNKVSNFISNRGSNAQENKVNLTKLLQSGESRDSIIEAAKSAGVSWKESDHAGINWMRCSMALTGATTSKKKK